VAACLAAVIAARAAAAGPTPVLSLAGHTAEVYSVAFAPDGKSLASAGNREVKVWDVAAGGERFTYPIKGTNVFGLAFSPDGRRLAVGISHHVKLLDAATGQEALTFPAAAQFLFRLGFSPDGKHLAASGGTNGNNVAGAVCVWEADTGKEALRLRGHAEAVLNVAYSRDGRLLASASGSTSGSRPGEVKIWEADTGRELQSFRGHADNVYGVTLSPDGRRVASCSGVRGGKTPGQAKLWEVVTGKEVLTMAGHAGPIFGVVFCPDGRRLATAGGDGKVKVWDSATGKELLSVAAHTGAVYSLSLSADGRLLASAGQDKAVKVWDLTGLIPEAPAGPSAPTERELEALWADLSGADAARAYRSLWKLASSPEQAVPFLRARLRPVTGLTPRQRERAGRWIGELDDNDFALRERATEELSRLGEAALPVLRQALAGDPPLEARRREERLLAVLAEPPLSAERLAALRSVEVLEHAGTAGARALLKTLAGGLPEARLTRDAKATLERVALRPAAP
jgi:WD40 repeat protein